MKAERRRMIAAESNTQKSVNRKRPLMKYTWRIIAVWTLILIGLLVYDLSTLSQITKKLVAREARTYIQRDISFRSWVANHGGLYVPITENTTPNPYLSHIPERDIETPSGKNLTLVNPAWALRQLNEKFIETYGVAGHITSLKPIRPENGPDNWERLALELFENGKTEVKEFTNIGDSPFLRLMKPLITEESCLKCHAQQGYVVGDIRGGISVAVPLASYLVEEEQSAVKHIVSFALLWVLGNGIIIKGSRIIRKKSLDREQVYQMLQESHNLMEIRVQERTSELDKINQKLQKEITEHKLTEDEVKRQLSEKEIILKEVHHRIKNNFTSIGSLLSIQVQAISNPEAISALQDAIGRVNSMSVLYKKLLLADDYSVTSLKEYLDNLIDEIISIFPGTTKVTVKKQIDDFQLDPKRLVSIGIIVNELLTNIMKYAFTGIDSSIIKVTLKEDQGNVTLTIQDNGNGLPEGFNIDTQKGFGLMLVKMLIQQLDGNFSIENHEGTRSTVQFRI